MKESGCNPWHVRARGFSISGFFQKFVRVSAGYIWVLHVLCPFEARAATLEDPVVVTASRVEEPLQRIGKSVSVVTAEDISREGSVSLVEALRNVPGVRIQQLGAPGKFSTIRIRGTRSFDTAVMINGMPIRDASDPQGSAAPFIEDFLVDDVEQVEVIRGSASTLYGSDALGGAINIIPKRGKEGRPRVRSLVDGGTHNTYRQTHQVSGATGPVDYFLSYTRLTSDGLREDDAYAIDSTTAHTGIQLTPELEVRFLFNADYSELDLNDSPAISGAVFSEDINDPNDFNVTRLLHYSGLVKHRLSEAIEHLVRVGFLDSDRRFVTRVDDADFFHSDSEFDGDTQNIEYQLNAVLSEYYAVTAGGEYEREWLSQNVNDVEDEFNQYRYAAYLENQLSFFEERLNISLGGRLGFHETARSFQSGEASLSYQIQPTRTRLKAHFGTGFRQPALFELFGRVTSGGTLFTFGNTSLKPEKSTSWDMGLEQAFFDRSLLFSGTFFRNDYSKRILFRNASYQNVTGGHTRGFELEGRWSPLEDLYVRASYTRTDGRMDGTSIENVPRTLIGASADYRLLEKLSLHADVTYRGDEQVRIFNSDTFASDLFDSDAYTKLDFKLSYQCTEFLETWFRAENILNEDIVESGFRNPGAVFYGGARFEH